jgi:SAM-dependent methyltransferase
LNKEKNIAIKRVTITGVNNVEALHYKKDHFGKAILDYQTNNNPENISTETSISDPDEMEVAYLFRDYKAMPKIEKKALDVSFGKILDVGGSKKSGYHELLQGAPHFHVINLDPTCEPDTFVDIEKTYPFKDDEFDGAVCLNVLEHIFEFQNAFSEQVRCVKRGGKMIFATPFMHHIHGSPDDYIRYTESSYRRLADKYDCTIESITPLGYGFFSLGYQCVGGVVPTTFIKNILRVIAVSLDTFFNRISKRYQKLTSRIPLGYFVVMVKN